MSTNLKINLEIKFEKLVTDACRQGYEQAISQSTNEEDAVNTLSRKIYETMINPFFQSEDFKLAYNKPSSSPNKQLNPIKLAEMRYQEIADDKIKEIIKSAWQMTMELKEWKQQQAKDENQEKNLSPDKVDHPKHSRKGLFGKKTKT